MIRCKFSSLPDKNKNHNSKNKIKILVKMDFSFNQSDDGRLQNSPGPGF